MLVGVGILSLMPLRAEPPPQINVFAAASLTDAMKEIGANYKGAELNFNLAASSILARQIIQGAPANIFISADEAKMNDVDKLALLVLGTRHDLLGNSLVVVASLEEKGGFANIQDLAKDKKAKITIGQPDTVPAGIYAKEYLTKVKLWDALKDQLVPTENVRAALAAVEAGNAQYGIVYKTDALISKKVHVVFEVPANEGPKIVYPVAMVAHPEKSHEFFVQVRAFEDYLFTPPAQAIFQKYGFQVLPAPSK